MKEVWKDVKGYEGLYQVSSLGRVKSVRRDILLKPMKQSVGYLQVNLKGKKFYVHRLVALHFIDNDKNENEINHIDGNKHNNSIINLEWCDRKYNILHAIKTNLKTFKLTKSDIKNIIKSNDKQINIAKEYNITQAYVSKIKRLHIPQ